MEVFVLVEVLAKPWLQLEAERLQTKEWLLQQLETKRLPAKEWLQQQLGTEKLQEKEWRWLQQ